MAELAGLKRFCLSLTGNPADADDLLQVTVERLLERGMPGDAHVAKWAYRVCRNLWIDELRAREVRGRYSQTDEASGAARERVSAEDEAELSQVNDALASLPEEQRAALLLVAVEGRSYAEAAEILEVPVGTIMSRVARGKTQPGKEIGVGFGIEPRPNQAPAERRGSPLGRAPIFLGVGQCPTKSPKTGPITGPDGMTDGMTDKVRQLDPARQRDDQLLSRMLDGDLSGEETAALEARLAARTRARRVTGPVQHQRCPAAPCLRQWCCDPRTHRGDGSPQRSWHPWRGASLVPRLALAADGGSGDRGTGRRSAPDPGYGSGRRSAGNGQNRRPCPRDPARPRRGLGHPLRTPGRCAWC